ncbi:MAG TPA: hypothetical protein VMV48_09050 [Gallionellaceae bacterium]|nr:hypothetical protein [Gallionellaceae bacterium]
MAGQYSHLQFFRRTPKALLARYFQERHGVLQEIAFDKLKEKDVESIFQGFMALPDDKQAEIEAECQDIDGMACQGGVTALADEADYHADAAFPTTLSKIDGYHGAAMWIFLDYPQYWTGATLFLHADNITESLWKKRNDLPHLPPHVEEEDTQRLAQAISQHFQKEGRGRNCKVEVFRRYDKEYFFAYPEDFAQSGVEWVRNSLAPRARHPAFEIVFVYCQAEGSLDIYAPRNTKSVPDMQQIFSKIILKFDDLDEFAEDSRVYVLDALANRDFVFKYPADCGIESVTVHTLRLSLKTGKKRRITVEAETKQDPKAVYDLMDKLSLPPFHVTQAEIKVAFSPTPGTRARLRNFKISSPNWCALRHDKRDLIIRKMLTDSGIEPKGLETKAEGSAA